jgi:hypothetical protein
VPFGLGPDTCSWPIAHEEALLRGGNITGISIDAGPEIATKRLELLREAFPRLPGSESSLTDGGTGWRR